MKNAIRISLLSLALLPGCLASDTGTIDEQGTTTVTLTAASQEGGVRPVIDLTLPGVRWIIEASEGPFDVHAFEVRVPGRTVALADWLIETRALDEEDAEALGGTRLVIEPEGPPMPEEGVGQHEMELMTRDPCRCVKICDVFPCRWICVCDCYPRPDGTWHCPVQ